MAQSQRIILLAFILAVVGFGLLLILPDEQESGGATAVETSTETSTTTWDPTLCDTYSKLDVHEDPDGADLIWDTIVVVVREPYSSCGIASVALEAYYSAPRVLEGDPGVTLYVEIREPNTDTLIWSWRGPMPADGVVNAPDALLAPYEGRALLIYAETRVSPATTG